MFQPVALTLCQWLVLHAFTPIKMTEQSMDCFESGKQGVVYFALTFLDQT